MNKPKEYAIFCIQVERMEFLQGKLTAMGSCLLRSKGSGRQVSFVAIGKAGVVLVQQLSIV
jgi:hypothetical protein